MTNDGFDVLWVGGNKFLVGERLADAVRTEIAHLKASPAPALLAELEAAKAALDAVYKIVTRQLSDPPNDDTAVLVEIAGIIEKTRGEG